MGRILRGTVEVEVDHGRVEPKCQTMVEWNVQPKGNDAGVVRGDSGYQLCVGRCAAYVKAG